VDRNERLREAVRRAARLSQTLEAVIGEGDTARATTLLTELRRAERERDDIMLAPDVPVADPPVKAPTRRHPKTGAQADGGGAGRGDGRPLREVVLDNLHALGRPTPIATLKDIVRVRDGVALPSDRLASMRRDEERSYDSASTRVAYVVPALSADRLTPVRGVLASSAFPLHLRILPTSAGRVDFLHVILALIDDYAARLEAAGTAVDPELGADTGTFEDPDLDEALKRYGALISRMARTLTRSPAASMQ
jgi:hypothetical protein